jgi:hypothetical protein
MIDVELVEIEPGKWRVKRKQLQPPRSDLPLPYVISDIMDPVEQVDGKFYTSKRQYRAVGRALGLTEVGNEKPKPRVRAKPDPKASIKKAIEQYKEAATHREAIERYTPELRHAK